MTAFIANSAVTIPAGVTVVVDIQLPQLTSITVDGTLVLRNLGTPQNIMVRGRFLIEAKLTRKYR